VNYAQLAVEAAYWQWRNSDEFKHHVEVFRPFLDEVEPGLYEVAVRAAVDDRRLAGFLALFRRLDPLLPEVAHGGRTAGRPVRAGSSAHAVGHGRERAGRRCARPRGPTDGSARRPARLDGERYVSPAR